MKAKDVTAKLDDLSRLIKRASEIVEIANVPAEELYLSISESCDAATREIGELVPIDLEAYERSFADWKVAWKDQRETLIDFCREVLGEVATRKKKELLAAYGKRLLFECHRAGIGHGWKEKLSAPGAKLHKFVEDPEAHRLLKRWGVLSKEAFKGDLKETDPHLITRAAQALGIKGSPKTKTFSDRLHTAATRFANNTMLF